jgi:hypothetical protein
MDPTIVYVHVKDNGIIGLAYDGDGAAPLATHGIAPAMETSYADRIARSRARREA